MMDRVELVIFVVVVVLGELAGRLLAWVAA